MSARNPPCMSCARRGAVWPKSSPRWCTQRCAGAWATAQARTLVWCLHCREWIEKGAHDLALRPVDPRQLPMPAASPAADPGGIQVDASPAAISAAG